jgi:hypothetical protein
MRTYAYILILVAIAASQPSEWLSTILTCIAQLLSR